MEGKREPITTKQAYAKLLCTTCRNGGDCGNECVESCTCSINCDYCDARLWFLGYLQDTPAKFDCPECGAKTTNPYSKGEIG